MSSTTASDSPLVTGLPLREISGPALPGRGWPVGPGNTARLRAAVGGHLTTYGRLEARAISDRWSKRDGMHGGTAVGSRGANAVVSGAVVLVHGRERKDGSRRR